MSVFLSIGTGRNREPDLQAGDQWRSRRYSSHVCHSVFVHVQSASGPECADVARLFRDLIHITIANGTVDTADTGVVSASAAQLAFFTPAGLGSATITLSVVQVTAAFRRWGRCRGRCVSGCRPLTMRLSR